jgi:hypothetical protein
MLDFYLGSVIVWFIILFSEGIVFNNRVRNNGWLNMQKERHNIIQILFCYVLVAAIPIFRLLMAVMIFVMAAVSKERFDELVEELEVKDNEDERPREN